MPRSAAPQSVITNKAPQKRAKSQELVYLYGLSGKAPKQKTAGLIGGVSPVDSVSESGIVGWFSRVSVDEFGEGLAARMEDLEWLAGASVRHQRVVAQIAEGVTLIPARFGTVFINEESLRKHLREGAAEFKKTLARLEGTEEWGVKVFSRAQPAPAVQAASGGDYLRAKAKLMKPARMKELDTEVKEFARALQAVAAESAPAGKVSSGQAGLEWQAAFLLRKRDRPAWDNVLRKYAARWGERREIQCTGPWPPYSFVG